MVCHGSQKIYPKKVTDDLCDLERGTLWIVVGTLTPRSLGLATFVVLSEDS